MNALTQSAPASRSLAYQHRKRRLDNGLTLVSVHLNHLHRASIAVFFKTGSLYESSRENGLSHFLEHMIFRGTELHPTSYELNLAVESLGGTLFAATAPDTTEFELTLPTECLAEGASLIAEVVTRPVFRDIEIERRIIAEEIREDLDEHGKPIDVDFLSRKRLWPGHPLGQSVTGPPENSLAFGMDDIISRFKDYYVAENAVVCVSGAFDQARLLPVVEELFSAIPARPSALTSPGLVFGDGPTTFHTHRPGSQTQLRIAFQAPGGEDPDRVALAVLLGILDDGMSTRLHRRIFDELGLAYNVGADLELYADAGAVNIDAAVSHEKVIEIVEQIGVLVADLKAVPVAAEELEKAKRREIWGIESFLDDPHAMSGWYGEQTLHWAPMSLEERVHQAALVDAGDVMRVARRIFTPGNMHITTVGVLDDAHQAELVRTASRFA